MNKGKRNIQQPTSNIQFRRKWTETREVISPSTRHNLSEKDGCAVHVIHESGSEKVYELEGRLMAFASAVIDLSESLPCTRAGNHVAAQILRSGTSPYPNHGEAEEAESRQDFIHKLKICLKELRETRRWARLIKAKGWAGNQKMLDYVLAESDELIRIFFASIRTAKQKAAS